MAGFDPFDFLMSLILFSVYGFTCVVAIIFTFSLDIYQKIDEKLNLDVFASKILIPIEVNIGWFNNWMMRHNRVFGPVLIILSLVDLKIFFSMINFFGIS